MVTGFRHWVRLGLAGLALALFSGCTFDVEGQLVMEGVKPDSGVDVGSPDVSAPDKECLWPKKVCVACEVGDDECSPPPALGGTCVEPDNPDFGCKVDTCTPCDPGIHATAKCLNNRCAIDGCEKGFWSCDGDPDTGCETDIRSLDNCGFDEEACGNTCSPANTDIASCADGNCRVIECSHGWGDCNNTSEDGCERNLRTLDDCGQCGQVCTVSNGTATCASGTCKVDQCPTGRADCGDNTCDTDITTTSNCGACGIVCNGPHVATWACREVGGNRVCQIVACESGWGNCDGNDGNGCETNLGTSVGNCSGCGKACSQTNVENRACVQGICTPTCAAGFDNCNGNKPGGEDDGCETPINTVTNCGACGKSCSRPNASATCASGICSIGKCNPDYANCDNDDPNGCEVHTPTNPNHCGGCGRNCSKDHITHSCFEGECNGNCVDGWLDCNTNKRSDGCEVNPSNNADHCGGCGQACSGNHITRSCSDGHCNGSCESGWADCNTNKRTDGCETNTSNNIDHCGGCGQACSGNHVVRNCSGGQCNGACVDGWLDCNNNKQSDGCETNTSNNVDHCGGCNRVCSGDHITRSCSGGQCNGTCASGWGDCNKNKQSDGCETDINTSSEHCGECDKACGGAPVGFKAVCQGGNCVIQCIDDQSCGHDGRCTSMGRCRCNETTCEAGKACSETGCAD